MHGPDTLRRLLDRQTCGGDEKRPLARSPKDFNNAGSIQKFRLRHAHYDRPSVQRLIKMGPQPRLGLTSQPHIAINDDRLDWRKGVQNRQHAGKFSTKEFTRHVRLDFPYRDNALLHWDAIAPSSTHDSRSKRPALRVVNINTGDHGIWSPSPTHVNFVLIRTAASVLNTKR